MVLVQVHFAGYGGYNEYTGVVLPMIPQPSVRFAIRKMAMSFELHTGTGSAVGIPWTSVSGNLTGNSSHSDVLSVALQVIAHQRAASNSFRVTPVHSCRIKQCELTRKEDM